jgi:putative transposase
LGSENFVTKVTDEYIDGKQQQDRELPAARVLRTEPTLQTILETVKNSTINSKLEKNVSIYLCHRYSGAGLREIGEKFGIKESAVSQSSRRLLTLLERDKELHEQIEKIRKDLRK